MKCHCVVDLFGVTVPLAFDKVGKPFRLFCPDSAWGELRIEQLRFLTITYGKKKQEIFDGYTEGYKGNGNVVG
jgi:hypothetical protein